MRRLTRDRACHFVARTLAERVPPCSTLRRPLTSFASVDECLRDFVNHERSGVPRGAGTNTTDGFDLGRMHRLLKDFGDPHVAYTTVHVSGTKGKGTTLSVLASVLRSAGKRVGTYKSPHVYTVAERIRSSDEDASTEVLSLLNGVETEIKAAQKREDGQLSYFEVLTALAFAYFKKAKVDLALVEVGLGGSRDATNVLRPENLEAAVITHIGEEHLAALGGSIDTIVDAKAGIAHEGRPVFYAPNADDKITQMLRRALKQRGANIIDTVSADVRLLGYRASTFGPSQEVDIDISVDGMLEARLEGVVIPLVGPHQRENVDLAVRVLWWLRGQGKIDVSLEDIRTGLESTRSPGNFEMFDVDGMSVIADGAHTKASAEMLVKTLGEIFPRRKVVFIVGMADDKDHKGFLEELYNSNPLAVICTQMEVAGGSSRTTPAKDLANALQGDYQNYDLPPEIVAEFDEALEVALAGAKDAPDAVVVVTGSLYTFRAMRNILEAQ